jgi:hypothetical protein
MEDARLGILEAAQVVGKKYIAPKISNVLRSQTYSSILSKISLMPLGEMFERQKILQEAPQKEQDNLDNFLRRSRELGIIEAAGGRGEYRFVNPLYHLYMWFLYQ